MGQKIEDLSGGASSAKLRPNPDEEVVMRLLPESEMLLSCVFSVCCRLQEGTLTEIKNSSLPCFSLRESVAEKRVPGLIKCSSAGKRPGFA